MASVAAAAARAFVDITGDADVQDANDPMNRTITIKPCEKMPAQAAAATEQAIDFDLGEGPEEGTIFDLTQHEPLSKFSGPENEMIDISA